MKTADRIGIMDLITAIKQGLIMLMPVFLIGSFALVILNIPIEAYKAFLDTFLGGAFKNMLLGIYNATFGRVSWLLALTVSYSFSRTVEEREERIFYPITALCAFWAFTYFGEGEIQAGPEWIFTVLCITVISSFLLKAGNQIMSRKKSFHTVGADNYFNFAIRLLIPVCIILVLFSGIGTVFNALFPNTGILNFGTYLFEKLFSGLGTNLFSALLYTVFSHVLWFFGIHGTNMLEAVSRNLFESEIAANAGMMVQGLLPTHIFSKTFLDAFVFIGGCGSSACFILAMFFAAKQRYSKKIAKLSAIPVLFNINEILIFGFPIILNPVMIVPFIVTPVVLLFISSGAMAAGLVPAAAHTVEWTVPVFFSGYIATGSAAGSILQLINVIVGTMIYIPFVKLGEKKKLSEFKEGIKDLETRMKDNEHRAWLTNFDWGSFKNKNTAKVLAEDLRYSIHKDSLELFYQPQINSNGNLYGAEALLRWHYMEEHYVFPPLVIALASENGFDNQLGLYIFEKACRDLAQMKQGCDTAMRISVNVLPSQLKSETFAQDVKRIMDQYGIKGSEITLEITEHVALDLTKQMHECIRTLKKTGICVSMDDFGAGHSSVMHLNNDVFDELKIDGNLVRNLGAENDKSLEIVSSILNLSNKFGLEVVAECVETKEQEVLLKEAGCRTFQGYFYSRPVPKDEFIKNWVCKAQETAVK